NLDTSFPLPANPETLDLVSPRSSSRRRASSSSASSGFAIAISEGVCSRRRGVERRRRRKKKCRRLLVLRQRVLPRASATLLARLPPSPRSRRIRCCFSRWIPLR
ncbi:hypothetical protein Taro_008608, partial [Colocasia esculenta]|nr:hypothetical protein [Colocasia esculenta]